MVEVTFIGTCLTDGSVSDHRVVLKCGGSDTTESHAEEHHFHGKGNSDGSNVKGAGS